MSPDRVGERSVLACTGHPQTVHQTNLTSGVSSLVRGIPYPNRCKTKVLQH